MARSNKLFKDLDISNKVSRNGFDLSHSVKFTAKVGELLPIMHRTVMPGDNFRINLESFTRTKPVNTAAFTRINEYFDFFFVPYRLLGKQIPHILASDKDNPTVAFSSSSSRAVGTKLPCASLSNLRTSTVPNSMSIKTNEFGFKRFLLSTKLLNHLGYCWLDDSTANKYIDGTASSADYNQYSINALVSLLPLAAYQKIYYDFYRQTQWEEQVPYNYNFDYVTSEATPNFTFPLDTNSSYWDNPTLFDLRYANYPKDLFFGLLPDSQYGDTATVDIDTQIALEDSLPVTDADGNPIAVGQKVDTVNNEGYLIQNSNNINLTLSGDLNLKLNNAIKSLKSSFDILEFRKARFTQKYREILGSGSKTYKAILKKVYNVDIPDTLTDECIYLGGHSQVINISEVENTNLADGNQATQAGKGLGSGKSSLINFDCKEYGIIMCIYHACPEIDFSLNAFHFDVTKVATDDYANPIFDKLGFAELPAYYLDNSAKNNVSQTPTIAYTTRYFDYKTSIDTILGDFHNGTLRTWVAPLNEEYLFEYDGTNNQRPGIIIDYKFFKVNPKILDSIFSGMGADSFVDTDQLRVSTKFSINAVRNLDYLGIPS